MSTAYTGDKTQLNDPDGVPAAGRQPKALIPVDGDPRNASTYQAGYKALADWIDFLRAPIARVAQWTEALKRYQNAQGHTRFRVDHMGLPGGWFQEHVADWIDVTNVETTGAVNVNPVCRGWAAHGNSTNVVRVQPRGITDPSESYVLCRGVRLDLAAAAVNDYVQVVAREALFTARPTCQGFMEGFFLVNAASNTDWDLAVGLASHSGSSCIVDASSYARLMLENSGAGSGTIKCQVRHSVSGIVTTVDTGLAIPSYRHKFAYRIEMHGSDVADDATNRVVFFINGNLVANIAAGLDSPNGDMKPFGAIKAIVGGASAPLELSPIRVCNSYLSFDAK